MSRILCVVISLFLIAPAIANDQWFDISRENKSKLNTYMYGKSCVEIGKTFVKNGWTKYRDPDYPPSELTKPTADSPNPLYKTFKKYDELNYCRGTGYGECYGVFKKDKFWVTVEYYAEGGFTFEDGESCGAARYAVTDGKNPIFP